MKRKFLRDDESWKGRLHQMIEGGNIANHSIHTVCLSRMTTTTWTITLQHRFYNSNNTTTTVHRTPQPTFQSTGRCTSQWTGLYMTLYMSTRPGLITDTHLVLIMLTGTPGHSIGIFETILYTTMIFGLCKKLNSSNIRTGCSFNIVHESFHNLEPYSGLYY